MQVFLFVLCVALAIVVIELILWAIGWVLRIAISLTVATIVVGGFGLLVVWLFTKLWPVFIILAVVGLVIVTVRLRSRYRNPPPYRSVDKEMLTRIYHIKAEGTFPCIAELLIRKGFFGTLRLSGRETKWVKAKKAA